MQNWEQLQDVYETKEFELLLEVFKFGKLIKFILESRRSLAPKLKDVCLPISDCTYNFYYFYKI